MQDGRSTSCLSSQKRASSPVSKQLFPRIYFLGRRSALSSHYTTPPGRFVNQHKPHRFCTLSTERWRNKTLNSWALCSCAAPRWNEFNPPPGSLISHCGHTPCAPGEPVPWLPLCSALHNEALGKDPRVSSGSSIVAGEELRASSTASLLDLVTLI